MTIQKLELVTSDKGDKRISIKIALVEDARATDGSILRAGFGFYVPIFLTPNENSTAQQIAEQVAMPIKAALGPKTRVSMQDCLNQPDLIIGKVVDVKVGVREGKKDFAGTFSNTVKAWIIPQA